MTRKTKVEKYIVDFCLVQHLLRKNKQPRSSFRHQHSYLRPFYIRIEKNFGISYKMGRLVHLEAALCRVWDTLNEKFKLVKYFN